MLNYVEIEFKGHRREQYRNPMEFPFRVGDLAVVEVDKGEHIGRVSHLGIRDRNRTPDNIHFNVLRKATPNDLKFLQELKHKELEAMTICRVKVKTHNLPMKLVEVEYQFDMKKLTFYFTADGRVDFRELVKDLAAHFHVRIDLRQIGARDETKRLNGYGICGYQFCCTTYLHSFQPITTQMAKVQNLSLNPQKLSGCCGRLKCCLKYELEQYIEVLKQCPLRESVYETPKGIAIIDKIDIFNNYIYLKYENGEFEKLTKENLANLKCIREGPPLEAVMVSEVEEEEIIAQDIVSDPVEYGELQGSEKPGQSGQEVKAGPEKKEIDKQYRNNSCSTPFPSEL